MKFILLLLCVYLIYRYVIKQPNRLPPQEPEIFIDHEEVKRDYEKNK